MTAIFAERHLTNTLYGCFMPGSMQPPMFIEHKPYLCMPVVCAECRALKDRRQIAGVFRESAA